MPRDPVKRKFYGQKACAKARGISFELSFAQWLSIWTESGHFHERGKLKDQYVMARFRDRGPYAVGNVRIITVEKNHSEMRHSAATRAKMKRDRTGANNSNYRHGGRVKPPQQEARL